MTVGPTVRVKFEPWPMSFLARPALRAVLSGASALVYSLLVDLNRLDYCDRLIVRAMAGSEPRADDGAEQQNRATQVRRTETTAKSSA